MAPSLAMQGRLAAIEVRFVRSNEYVALRDVRLNALAYAPELAEHLSAETSAPIEFWCQRAERGEAAITMATFVAASGTVFIGVIDGVLSESGEWVSPGWRQLGIGRDLLEAVCKWAQGRGAR